MRREDFDKDEVPRTIVIILDHDTHELKQVEFTGSGCGLKARDNMREWSKIQETCSFQTIENEKAETEYVCHMVDMAEEEGMYFLEGGSELDNDEDNDDNTIGGCFE